MTLFLSRNLQALLLIFTLALSPIAFADSMSRSEVLQFNASKVMNTLSDALLIHDEIPTLEDSKWLTRDKKSARSDLDKLVSRAIDMLESGKIKVQQMAKERAALHD